MDQEEEAERPDLTVYENGKLFLQTDVQRPEVISSSLACYN